MGMKNKSCLMGWASAWQQDQTNLKGPNGSIRDHMLTLGDKEVPSGLFKAIPDNTGLYKTILSLTCPYWSIQDPYHQIALKFS